MRYDINPFTPERVYRIEDISHAARVYRKSRKGFISLRSVLKGTTLTGGVFLLFIFLPQGGAALGAAFLDGTKAFKNGEGIIEGVAL